MEFNILYAIQGLHNPLFDKIMLFFTEIGEFGAIWIVLSLILLIRKDTRKAGVSLAIALVLSLIIGNKILKPFIGRLRPCMIDTTIKLLVERPMDFSFPSGHTYSSVAAIICTWYYNRKIGIACLIVGSLVSFSRLYLFLHFPTDILGGVVLGAILAAIAIYITNKLKVFKRTDKIDI